MSLNTKEVEDIAKQIIKRHLGDSAKDIAEAGDLEYNGIHIEVKADMKDWDCEPNEIIRDWIVIASRKEREFFENNPDRFEFWCIGNMKREPKIVKISGRQLKEWVEHNPEKKELLLKIKMGKAFFEKYPNEFITPDISKEELDELLKECK